MDRAPIIIRSGAELGLSNACICIRILKHFVVELQQQPLAALLEGTKNAHLTIRQQKQGQGLQPTALEGGICETTFAEPPASLLTNTFHLLCANLCDWNSEH